jgi:hypothetical protein
MELLEKLTVVQMVSKFYDFSETWRFSTSKTPPLYSVLTQFNLVHTVHFDVILPIMLGSPTLI